MGYVQQVLGHFVRKGALSTVCMCTCCPLMSKDYVGRNSSPEGRGKNKVGNADPLYLLWNKKPRGDQTMRCHHAV